MRPEPLLLFLLAVSPALADDLEFGGHGKLRLLSQSFPADSLFRDAADANSFDLEADLRLEFLASGGRWQVEAAYQLLAVAGDRIEWSRSFVEPGALLLNRLPNDDRRMLSLTDVIHDQGRSAQVQRLDRLSLRYSSDSFVVRVGRQALSWGNGLFYSPMDLVNPFDPAAIDTEFKAGDDMLYMQYLRDNGHDWQSAIVLRRNPLTGDVESGHMTAAVKYHGIAGDAEFDLLFADSYDSTVVGFGGSRSIGGAIVRGDLVVSDTDDGAVAQALVNFSYSWAWGGRNVSGAFEFYYSGFGESKLQPDRLAGNPELLRRVERGELFTLGRYYGAAGLTIELSPLWTLSPVLLSNLGDTSALLQIGTQLSVSDSATFIGNINLPLGSSGSEFGGIPSGKPDTYLSSGPSIFAQIAWYF